MPQSSEDTKPQLSEFESEVEEEIEQARIELTTVVLEKQKDVVLRIGQALEKIRKDDERTGVCEEVKHRLREEIARGLISIRTIEAYCRPEWKNPARAKSGRKGAESKNRLMVIRPSVPIGGPSEPVSISEKEGQQEDKSAVNLKQEGGDDKEEEENRRNNVMMIRTDGSADESASGGMNEWSWKLREQELLDRLNEKDDIILGQEKEVARVKEEAQSYMQKALQNLASSEPQGASQEQEAVTKITNHEEPVKTSAASMEFEFWLAFDTLRLEMDRQYRKHGTAAKIWIHGGINNATGKVFDVDVGRLENAATEEE